MLMDRYLLTRYWHAFFILFAALLGLYIVIDVFANVDEFTKNGKSGATVVQEMIWYYVYRTASFANMLGGMLSVAAAVITLAVLLRHAELSPVLSAGIPTYRLARPLLFGSLLVNGLLTVNQEVLIPRIAVELQMRPGADATTAEKVRPMQDFSSRILILSGLIYRRDRKLTRVEFVLPVPEVAQEPTTLRADEAVYLTDYGPRPGWLLKGVSPKFDEIGLTAAGTEAVLRGSAPDELFVGTDIDFDQVCNRQKIVQYLSTAELLERARNPAFSLISIRSQSLHLHQRLVRPLVNVLLILVVIPLTIRRETRHILTGLASSAGALFGVVGLGEVCGYLGGANLLPLAAAAWAPVLAAGLLAAWCASDVRT